MFPANLSCQLFGTLGCHLCEQAEETLKPLLAQGASAPNGLRATACPFRCCATKQAARNLTGRLTRPRLSTGCVPARL